MTTSMKRKHRDRIVRRGLAMMSKRNFPARNPSLCTDLAGFACSLVLGAFLVSQSSRTCACSPTSNSGHWHLVVPSFPCLTSRSVVSSQLHHPGRPRALLQPAPKYSVLVSIVLRSKSPLSNPSLLCFASHTFPDPFSLAASRRLYVLQMARTPLSPMPWCFPACVGVGVCGAAAAAGGRRCRKAYGFWFQR